jgi:carnitine O-acetyltransferase
MDGTPTLRMNEFMLATLATNKIDLGPKRDTATGTNLPEPTELKFVLDSSGQLENAVRQAARRFDSLVEAHDLHVQTAVISVLIHTSSFALQVLHYEGYGKEAIKQFRASPDAWAQLVKQLAFQKMFGRPGVTYESAQTRKYQLGRTEVIRSASNETKKWALAMLDPTETVCAFSSLNGRARD